MIWKERMEIRSGIVRFRTRMKWKDYREMFNNRSSGRLDRVLFSYYLVKRYSNRYEGFVGPNNERRYEEEYSYEAIIKLKWGWFLAVLPFMVIFNFFLYAWKGGLSQYPRISRVVSVESLSRNGTNNRGFLEADIFWNNRKGEEIR